MIKKITDHEQLKKIMDAIYHSSQDYEWYLDMIAELFHDNKDITDRVDALRPERDALWDTFPTGDVDRDDADKDAIDAKARALLDSVQLPVYMEAFGYGQWDTGDSQLVVLFESESDVEIDDVDKVCNQLRDFLEEKI